FDNPRTAFPGKKASWVTLLAPRTVAVPASPCISAPKRITCTCRVQLIGVVQIHNHGLAILRPRILHTPNPPRLIDVLTLCKEPGIREKTPFIGLLAVPVWGPETLGAIEILGDTIPQANTLHQALTAYSLQSVRQTFPQFPENRVAV